LLCCLWLDYTTAKICVKLVGFEEQKQIFGISKTYLLTELDCCRSVSTALSPD
jgi:hypothetical protein